MKLIGLTGPAGCGKDTAGAYLCRKHGFVRYGFADPLKAMLLAIGVDMNDRDGKEKPHPVFGVSPRRMAQTLGMDWMRDMICKDGWLRLAEQFIDDEFTPANGIVFTDVRFENEAEMIRRRGGAIWHLKRNVPGVEAHVSERPIVEYLSDRQLLNNSTMDHLYGNIETLLWGMGA